MGAGSAGRRQRGFALVTVLWFLALMSLAAAGALFLNRVELKSQLYLEDKTRAYFQARAGVARALADLSALWAARRPWMAKADGSWTTWREGDGGGRYLVQSECGKLNLNRASGPMVERLLALAGVGPEQARIMSDSLQDWSDGDSATRPNGAERDYYLAQRPPSLPRNGPPGGIAELSQVRGWSMELLLGLVPRGKDELVYRGGLWRLLSVYEKNSKVDVNAAPAEVLMSLPGMNMEILARLVAARAGGRFQRLSDVRRAVGEFAFRAISPMITASPCRTYTVVSEGESSDGHGRHTIMTVAEVLPGGRVRYLFWADDLYYPVEDMGPGEQPDAG